MSLRAEIVREKLLDLGETVSRLRAWLPVTVERLEQDLTLQWAVEHGLQIAAEALFDVGSGLVRPPRTAWASSPPRSACPEPAP